MKKCTKCGEHKKDDEFNWNSNTGRRLAECKDCYNRRHRKRYHANKNKPSEIARRLRNERRKCYGIEEPFIQDMMNKQRGCCAICSTDFSETKPVYKKNAGYVIDHDHNTGKIRALLCSPCNIMLGYYEKHIKDNLEKIQRYLGEPYG